MISNGWSEQERDNALILTLRGPATVILQTTTKEQQSDFTLLMQFLDLRYGEEDMKNIYKAKLLNRVKKNPPRASKD